MNCKCGKQSIKEEEGIFYCRKHWIEYKESIFLDNTDMHNLGIVQWSRYLLSEYTSNLTPEIHKEILMLIMELFDPIYQNRHHRMRNIISFRGSAKSSLVNMILPSYLITHNGCKMKIRGINGEIKEVTIDERFIVIASETGSSAEDFVVRIRDELSSNQMLKYFYGGQIEDALDADDGQWTRRAFKYNKCFIMGAGVGQQIRGKIKGAYRITTLLVDDLYSENNTKTIEARKNVRKWFYNAAINTIDDIKGKAVVVGTILHEDTIIIDNKKSKKWKTVEFPVMPLNRFQDFIKQHLTINPLRAECSLPLDNEEDEYKRITGQEQYFKRVQEQEDWGLVWADRINLYSLALKYQELVEKRETSSMYQEYFHVVIGESEKKFRKEYFKYYSNVEYMQKYNFNWLKIGDKTIVCNIELGIDIGSGSTDGDDTAISIVATLPTREVYVLDVVYGKLRMRDRDVDDNSIPGLFDEIIRQVIKYNPYKVKIGYAGSEKGYIELIRQYITERRLYCMVIGRLQQAREGTKEERIARTLLHLYESGLVYHPINKLVKLETQLEFLGKTKEDDCADSLEVAVYHIDYPMDVNIASFETPKMNRRPFMRAISNDYDYRVN